MRPRVSWFKRVQFSGQARIEIYELLALLLDNRVILIDALREIRNVYSTPRRNGGKPRQTMHSMAVSDWIEHLESGDSSGFPLSRAVSGWVPPEEAALIQSGEATGNLGRALGDCVSGIIGRGEMVRAVVSGTAYPLLLLAGAFWTMRIFAQKVVPPFARQVDPALWEGAAHLLYLEVQAFNNYAVPGAIVLALLTALAIWSMPYYTGPGRTLLDRWIPPWNIYKVIQGATFLKNVAVQTRAGIQLFDTVSGMLPLATPWLRERLQAAMYGIEQGQNLGEALHNAGYEFPDGRSVQILRVLASRDGFDDTLYNFAKRWEAGTVKRVENATRVFLIVAILIMGGITGTALLGMQSLSAMVEDSADAVSSNAQR